MDEIKNIFDMLNIFANSCFGCALNKLMYFLWEIFSANFEGWSVAKHNCFLVPLAQLDNWRLQINTKLFLVICVIYSLHL